MDRLCSLSCRNDSNSRHWLQFYHNYDGTLCAQRTKLFVVSPEMLEFSEPAPLQTFARNNRNEWNEWNDCPSCIDSSFIERSIDPKRTWTHQYPSLHKRTRRNHTIDPPDSVWIPSSKRFRSRIGCVLDSNEMLSSIEIVPIWSLWTDSASSPPPSILFTHFSTAIWLDWIDSRDVEAWIWERTSLSNGWKSMERNRLPRIANRIIHSRQRSIEKRTIRAVCSGPRWA